MLKRKVDEYLKVWYSHRKQALLIKGARQIGKTFSIKEFGNHNFENVIEINFVLNPSLIKSFYAIEDYKQMMLRISLLYGQKLVPGKTLIFFDEIQLLYEKREEEKKNGTLDYSLSDLITIMKDAVSVGEYRFILSGSLLGITLNSVKSFPVGYLDEYQMYPLDFEEFLWAKGVGNDVISYVNERFENKEKVDEEINKRLLELFKEYVLIGGMPEVLETYINSNNLYLVDMAQKQIINNYKSDITTYIHDENKRIRVKDIYNSIPSELNSKNKRFISSHVIDKNYLKNNDLKDDFLWLTNAGVAIPVYNVTDPVLPLVLSSNRKTLKLFINDIGLLGSMLLTTGIRE
ncbi:MAG: ATP-binding protein, partial [Bacilli bacterium]|nr:ATP-binding protein [Bacilli bacterium]